VIDPTLATFEAMFTTDPGELDPVIAPYAGRLPAQIERGAHNGGLPTKDRATFRASYAQALKLVKKAWDRGITVVAGTDAGAGITVSRELELYVQAGIPAADVLAIATIGAARVMKLDKESGSITAGKRADLVLLDGDPLAAIGAVRNADIVICRGRIYDPAALLASVGMKPRT
jgi:imidazolonepropionase-like amidohydrolase